MTVTRKLIRADGTETELVGPHAMTDLKQLIGADVLTSVWMKHMGVPLHVMLVDDSGHDKGLPVNEKATSLYHANCRPGVTHENRGDVVLVPDGDFAEI